MAESDGEERTEEPTGKRLEDAREKGQVPKSRELGTVASLLAAAAAFITMGGYMLQSVADMLSTSLNLSREQVFDTKLMIPLLGDAVFHMLEVFSPFFFLMALVGVASSVVISGWMFSAEALTPKLEKLNPITGMGRLFSWRGLVELAKSLAKFILVASVAYLVLSLKADDFLGLGTEPLYAGLSHMGHTITWVFLWVSCSLILVVIVDVPFQLWDHKRQLKMTKQEIKEEHKQSDGSPEVKGRQRQIQYQMSQRRMMEAIPSADVVVTNPTHYAVALRYDQDNMDAPKVVAKGADLIAMKIRGIAKEHDVPILSAPPLARALFHSAELDEYVPEGLYRAVAQVLAYVYHLRQGPMYDRSGDVSSFEDLPIPDELRRDD